jgi:hypothetical protein
MLAGEGIWVYIGPVGYPVGKGGKAVMDGETGTLPGEGWFGVIWRFKLPQNA